jgi:hypothetical protein
MYWRRPLILNLPHFACHRFAAAFLAISDRFLAVIPAARAFVRGPGAQHFNCDPARAGSSLKGRRGVYPVLTLPKLIKAPKLRSA